MAKWDVSRFLNTVGYFGAIPVVSDLQRWLTGGSNRQSTSGGGKVGTVLVIGAMSEIGQLVVQQLAKSGYRVRAAISDLSLTPFSVPANVEFVQLEIDNSITDRIMQGVRSIIVCPDPQNAGSAEAIGNLATAANTYLAPTTQSQLFDFTQPTIDLQATWGAVDDVVIDRKSVV